MTRYLTTEQNVASLTIPFLLPLLLRSTAQPGTDGLSSPIATLNRSSMSDTVRKNSCGNSWYSERAINLSTHSRSSLFRLQIASLRVRAASAALSRAGPGFDDTERLSISQISCRLSLRHLQNSSRSPVGSAGMRASSATCIATPLGSAGGVCIGGQGRAPSALTASRFFLRESGLSFMATV